MKRIWMILLVILLLVPLVSLTAYAAAAPSDAGSGNFLLDGLKKLFVPRNDYFPRFQARLSDMFQAKFGNALSVVDYLKERFSNLQAYRGDLLVMKFPRNHLFGGANIDLLEGAEKIAEMIRGAMSGFIVLCTAAFAYKRVLAMINT